MQPPTILGAALLVLAAGGCCVDPPHPGDWLAVGWRSPTQAFESFQTAIRADSAELEYRAFSVGFRERNGISKLVWREARIQLRERYPWLRKGIADARFTNPPTIAGDRASGVVESHGTRIAVEFVREDFAQLWQGDELVADEYVRFRDVTFVQTGSDQTPAFHGHVALPSGDETGSAITELTIGREWKIDSFQTIDPDPASSRAEDTHREKGLD